MLRLSSVTVEISDVVDDFDADTDEVVRERVIVGFISVL